MKPSGHLKQEHFEDLRSIFILEMYQIIRTSRTEALGSLVNVSLWSCMRSDEKTAHYLHFPVEMYEIMKKILHRKHLEDLCSIFRLDMYQILKDIMARSPWKTCATFLYGIVPKY